jgi:LysR family transcriptional regulator, benzoate and cis,cis-muconate-responsive activator of ben and cat genes
MMIELRHLRYFLAVAAERNFTRAAERLNMAQPPLSRQIHQLEQELGAPLFDRDSRPLKLTAAGRLFYEQAIQVTQRMDELKALMRRFVAAERRRFVIGFVPSVIYARLPSIIRGFREAAPDVELSLVEMMSLEQIGALKEGRIDVGFGRIRFDDPAVRRDVLREERLGVALPAGHPLLAGERPIELAALAEGALIVYPREPRPSYADQVLSLFRDHGVEPASVQEVRELQTAIGLVAAEAGACIVPASVRLLGRTEVVYRDLAQPATSPIILSRRVGDHSPELAALVAVVGDVYRRWGWSPPPGLLAG